MCLYVEVSLLEEFDYTLASQPTTCYARLKFRPLKESSTQVYFPNHLVEMKADMSWEVKSHTTDFHRLVGCLSIDLDRGPVS